MITSHVFAFPSTGAERDMSHDAATCCWVSLAGCRRRCYYQSPTTQWRFEQHLSTVSFSRAPALSYNILKKGFHQLKNSVTIGFLLAKPITPEDDCRRTSFSVDFHVVVAYQFQFCKHINIWIFDVYLRVGVFVLALIFTFVILRRSLLNAQLMLRLFLWIPPG